MPRLVWSTVFDDSTMFPTLWRRCIGYEFQSVINSNWRSWSTKYCTAPLQNTSDRLLGCPTFRVDHHCDLHQPIIFSSRQFFARLLVQGRLRYLGQLYGTVCRLTLRLSTVGKFSSSSKKIFIRTLITRRCSITVLFYRGLEAFCIAHGHVNVIRNYYH